MKTISVINLKGGVGKTISSINIACILAGIKGKKVLLIDNDKQGNSSKFFGLHNYKSLGVSEMLTQKDVRAVDLIQRTNVENLDIITANMNLLESNKKVLLDSSRTQQNRYLKALESVKSVYDFCIIDNAPDINMSVINGLVLSNYVIVPIKVDKFAFDGLEQLLETVDDIKEMNGGLKFLGCFITCFAKNGVNKQGEKWLCESEGGRYRLFSEKIRKTVKVDESTFEGKPLYQYAKKCTASIDYINLVEEILLRIG